MGSRMQPTIVNRCCQSRRDMNSAQSTRRRMVQISTTAVRMFCCCRGTSWTNQMIANATLAAMKMTGRGHQRMPLFDVIAEELRSVDCSISVWVVRYRLSPASRSRRVRVLWLRASCPQWFVWGSSEDWSFPVRRYRCWSPRWRARWCYCVDPKIKSKIKCGWTSVCRTLI